MGQLSVRVIRNEALNVLWRLLWGGLAAAFVGGLIAGATWPHPVGAVLAMLLVGIGSTAFSIATIGWGTKLGIESARKGAF